MIIRKVKRLIYQAQVRFIISQMLLKATLNFKLTEVSKIINQIREQVGKNNFTNIRFI